MTLRKWIGRIDMANELTTLSPEILSSLILRGDISGLDPHQRVQYVTSLCQRIGLDPLTQPFKILRLQGKEVLYADKGASQQLCKIYGISTQIIKKEMVKNVYVVSVRASDKSGRFTDEDGAVTINDETQGDVLANALLKAITKAKRRAVLAFCGLGMLDDSEISTIRGAKTEPIDMTITPQVIDMNPEVIKEKQDKMKKEAEIEKKVLMMRRSFEQIKTRLTNEEWESVLIKYKLTQWEFEDLKDVAVGATIYGDMQAIADKKTNG